ncbi:MAG TPA: lipid A biosynthesis acyltransferase [Burkholderiales bacterium]|nr:lipid A biosynthesis acyltransferase [Burkholderiales bacterium]
MTRLALGLLWLLHFLPRPVIAHLGEALGGLLYHFGRGRVTKTNLKLCFPELSDLERETLAKKHFRSLGRSVLEQSILWYGSDEQVIDMVKLVDRENLDRLAGKPVILLSPHFVGLDFGGARIGSQYRVCSMYSQQKNKVLNDMLLKTRMRWGNPELVARQQGLRPLIKHIKNGLPFYYLPDMDFGEKESIFSPFFGVLTATVPAVSRLARLTGAAVVPCIARQLSVAEGYEVRLYPAWENFPGESVEEDTRRMNAFIEDRVREMPEQYFWVHKRFKTRPAGEKSFYKDAEP